jgi:hypothetical protein
MNHSLAGEAGSIQSFIVFGFGHIFNALPRWWAALAPPGQLPP